MNTIIREVYSLLKTTGLSVYDVRPLSKATYPFISYELSEPISQSNPRIIELSVDIWYESKSYLEVEDMATMVNKLMETTLVNKLGNSFRLTKESEYRLPDPNEKVRRKQINFQLRIFNWE